MFVHDLLHNMMKNLLTLFLLIGLFLAKNNVYAEEFRYLRTLEGLSDGEITSIAQDSVGNIWIGSFTGLTKYDGTRLITFRPELGNSNSIPDKKIKSLFVDSKNNLWILSSRFLCFYNDKKDEFRTIRFGRNATDNINILYISEYQKNIVIHTAEGFYLLPLSKLSNTVVEARKIEVFESGSQTFQYFYYSKAISHDFFLFNQSAENLYVLYKAEFDIQKTDTLIKISEFARLNHPINDLEIDHREKIVYLATGDGLECYSVDSGEKLQSFFNNNVLSQLYVAGNHRIYCASAKPELLYYDFHNGETGKYTPNPNKIGTILNSRILSLAEDFSGNLWIGHQGLGISILNLYPKGFKTFNQDPVAKNSLNSNTILSFNETSKEIIIGCRNDGINIISKEDLENGISDFISLNLVDGSEKLNVSGVWDIKKETENRFWLATETGLFILSKRNGTWNISPFTTEPEIDDLIWKIFIDENRNVWCGTYNQGIIFIPDLSKNPKKKYFRYQSKQDNKFSLSDNYVTEFFLDSKERFWIGTLNGLNLLEGGYHELNLTGNALPDLRFKRYYANSEDNTSLNNNEINCLYENFDGNLWITTSGGGINILDTETQRFQYITTGQGLPSNDVFGILPDSNGKIWISTLKGLVCYDQLNDSLAFSVFDRYDGVQGDVFMKNAYFKTAAGDMFFGGDNGFSFFDPLNIRLNTFEPKIALSEFYFQSEPVNTGDTIRNGYVLEKPINYMEKIILPPKQNYFKIVVSTLHFQAPQKNKFTYILDGYMNNWSTSLTSEKTIEFANIPYGKYEMKIKAINPDNIVSSNTKTIQLEIQPPWYRTWYMSSIIILVVFSALAGLVYIIVNRQRLIYIQKIDKIKITNNENKMMFLTNIAHELRTPLSLVIAPVEDLVKNFNDNNSNAYWKSHLQLIHRNSNYLLRLINQIIDFRKLNVGQLHLQTEKTDIVRLIKDVALNFKGFEIKRKINLLLDVPSDSVMVPVDSQKIEEVLYNLISNAFKNTYESGSITVSMKIIKNSENGNVSNQIRITVFNEGKEIPVKHQKLIFERFYKINEKDEGAGIGLSFAKSLVELHKGKITVENLQNKGVAFHIDLFFEDEMMEKSEFKIPAYDINELKTNVLTSEKEYSKMLSVLIVEDNIELREFLFKVLSRNYNCKAAKNGKEAWDIVSNEKPSIVISDVIMNEMDGFELCEKIKKKKETCHIPVILLTAKDSNKEKEKGFEVGADAYVTKPFDINLLLSQVDRLIKNRQLIREKYLSQNFMVEIESNYSKDEEFLQNVKDLLDKNISDPDFNVNRLAEQLNISSTQLYRRIKALTEYSPVEFIRIVKLQKAYTLLGQRSKTVKEVCFSCGFNNLSYFIKCFKDQFGVTPASFRDSGKVTQKNLNNIKSTIV